jgi:hypothetical protein
MTVFDPIDGISPITRARKAGVVAPPEVGPAHTVFALSFAEVTASVPEVVTGDPDTLNSTGVVMPTDVTVPVPEAVIHEGTPEEFSESTTVPTEFPARLVHVEGPR